MPLDIISYSKLKTKADLVGGKIPSTQLPSYVDDILEYADIQSFPEIGESGKIYVDLDTNRCYRWSGTQYTEVSPSLALGETSATAYRGDRGKTAYDHSQLVTGNPHNVTAGEISYDNAESGLTATDVNAAIDEIEVHILECAKVYSYTGLSLSGASWLDTTGDFPYYQTISVPGIVSGDEPFTDIVTTGLTKQQIIDMQNAWASIYEIETGTDEITFRSLEPITVDINLKVKVIK